MRHQQPLMSNNRGSAGERETPEHQLSPCCAIASALGSGPDLPVVPVSGGKTQPMWARLCVGIVIAQSQSRQVYTSLAHGMCRAHPGTKDFLHLHV